MFCRDKQPIQIKIGAPAELPEMVGLWTLPAAVVVRGEDLETFGKCGEPFKDSTEKDKRKGLSEYLLGKGEKIPFINAVYIDYGRLISGIVTLLQNAEKAGEQGIYLLGVSEDHYLTIWNGAITEDAALQLAPKGNGLLAVLKQLPGEEQLRGEFWGGSEAYHMVRQLILRAAQISDPVLILGEAGTGKSLVAQEIHDRGQKDEPFVVVNCAAITSDLFESEVFGYEPGAFPGALPHGKPGQWELAGVGTLFLDEIGDLRLDNQAKVLYALKEGSIRRMGALKDTPVYARVIAATNRDLYGMVQRGKFREDLYYRLRQYLIRTPELRDDPQSLKYIAQKIWQEITESNARLPKEILEDLGHHPWPGNVRELRSVLRSLYNYFWPSAPTREQLNAVFQHFGLAAGYGQRDFDASEPALLQMECLRMICRADEAIRACEQELKPLAEEHPLSAVARDSLARILEEMQILMRNRLFFGSEETYQAVARVAENLDQLLSIPRNNTFEHSSFWLKNLAPDIHQAVTLLFAEIKKLRSSMSNSAKMDSSSV
jgi:DNA-binding NtrC family response regulator